MRRILTPLLCVLSLAVVTAARAGAPRSLALLAEAPGRVERPWEDLRRAIEAHLSPHGVEVRIVPLEDREPGATAADLSRDPGVVAVVWLDAGDERLWLTVPALGERQDGRDAPDGGEGWTARCEVLASIVLSGLEPLLAGAIFAPPAGPDEADVTEPVADEPVADLEAESGPAAGDAPRVRVGLGVAYLPVWMSAGSPYRSGLAVTALGWFGRHLEVDVGLDLVQPTPLGLESGRGDLGRQMLRAAVVGVVPAGRLDLGFGAGPVIEFVRVRDLGYQPLDPGATDRRMHGGILLLARIRVRPVPWLALYADLGADLYGFETAVVDGDQELLRRAPVQPRIALGVMGLLARR